MPAALAAQTQTQDEVPDSLRFVPVGEVPGYPQQSTFPSGDEFDMAFEDIPLEDFEVEEDYSLAISYMPFVSFDRVDGWILGVDLGFKPQSGWFPAFDMRYTYALGRKRILYNLGIAQPVLKERRLMLGINYRRFSDNFDSGLVASGENFVSAFGARYDYRDYFERTGAAFYAESQAMPWLFTSLTYVSHDYRSLAVSGVGTWTLFRNGSDWRENPAIDEGQLQSMTLRVELDARDNEERPRKGGWLLVDMEWSSDDLGSDFTFSRYALEGRGYLPLTPMMNLKGRLGLGTTSAGRLPFQKHFTVGGISTIPAVNYKQSRGDHYFLGNLEYGFEVWQGKQRVGIKTNVRLLAALDVGQAWFGDSYDLNAQHMLIDAGLGIALADERFKLYVLQDLNNTKFDPLWTLRFSSPF
jgi:hypothetical protein